ncbi:hypothetical protein RFI_04986 [Reticulomyxa filosa]|uniref:Kelch motif family protein n=1 Tax=Reticulomyxa filosa TaxID=46433 RepID=X6P1W8_RETFI|nr:hypothetical protein RFI_04986 [Reticulomyxa filosa]|eukprot:ETO32133.1 hypothetical protein RFI_04986 [Reticulomyxa filosa]
MPRLPFFFFLKKNYNISNMGNQTTIQKPPEHLITNFQALKELPSSLDQTQCVIHKHEILICGGQFKRACYSYHILKDEYKFICEYSPNIELKGHCVVKLTGSNGKYSNQITLLSFGGWDKHSLMMNYVSVWSKISTLRKPKNSNEWIPLVGSCIFSQIIGIGNDYGGVRAVIGGRSNHLLFITHYPNNISVFDLNTFQFIKNDTLPTNNFITYHCFVSNSENGQGQEIMKTNEEKNKQNYQMLLFCFNTGLSIEYDEDNNIFQFYKLSVCDDIAPFYKYAYVCINDVIFFFGGWNGKFNDKRIISKSVYKYSIRENKWMIFQDVLPSLLYNCTAILNEEDNDIHIIGGVDSRTEPISTHIKTKVSQWNPSWLMIVIHYWTRILKIKLGWIDELDKLVINYIINAKHFVNLLHLNMFILNISEFCMIYFAFFYVNSTKNCLLKVLKQSLHDIKIKFFLKAILQDHYTVGYKEN